MTITSQQEQPQALPILPQTKGIVSEVSAATIFTCHAPACREVFLAGSFNDWDAKATPMVKDAEGHWGVAVTLMPGRHEYKFVVDGEWCCEPGCETAYHGCSKCVPNSFGTMNRFVEVT